MRDVDHGHISLVVRDDLDALPALCFSSVYAALIIHETYSSMPCWKQKRARYAELLSFVFPFRTLSLRARQPRARRAWACAPSAPYDEHGGRNRRAECSAMGVTENRRACACTVALQLGRAGVRSAWADRQACDQAGRRNGKMSSAETTMAGEQGMLLCHSFSCRTWACEVAVLHALLGSGAPHCTTAACCLLVFCTLDDLLRGFPSYMVLLL
jgi:hypothetical protein